jgi:polyhydroxybutyrate depolymerase
MRRILLGLCLAWLAGFGGGAAGQSRCGIEAGCAVRNGIYRVSPPAGWDGRSPLPAVLFFHGYGGSAEAVMADADLRRSFSDLGILLAVADSGPRRDWVATGSTLPRDDVAYARDVLDDLGRRWPLREGGTWVAGFSAGGFMVWRLACQLRLPVAGYVAIAGTFLEPPPRWCPGGTVNFIHVHGLADNVVPLEGRFVPRYDQGPGKAGPFTEADLFASFAVLRQVNGCHRSPDSYATAGAMTVREWTCRGGKRLAMALHSGGHVMPEGWPAFAWGWLNRREPAPAGKGE